MYISRLKLLIVALFGLAACQQQPATYRAYLAQPNLYHQSLQQLTDVIVHDIFSPPVASRIYAYPNIAAYEVLRQAMPDYPSLAGQLRGMPNMPEPSPGQEIDYELAALEAFLQCGQAMVFSEDDMEAYREGLYDSLQTRGMSQKLMQASLAHGRAVAAAVMAWANEDNYHQTRSFPKYTVTRLPNRWKPTPPDYMEGIEPHWNKIRLFVADSAQQFKPEPPPSFSTEPGSRFFEDVMNVYHAVNQSSEEQIAIAKFWDCNPFVSQHQGHAMFALKKITPGGHWMGITGLAARKAELNLMETIRAYVMVSISLADAFIVCWDEKYRSSLVRPETVINEYIDPDWLPLLQTPPFPEYTSGHSVVSTAASVALTHLLGENFAFADSTELPFGLPVREYDSFRHAAEEAAISRLYGGIHYMPAIEQGKWQGEQVGRLVVERLNVFPNDMKIVTAD